MAQPALGRRVPCVCIRASSLSDLDFCPPQTLCRQAASLQTVSFSRAHTQAVLALFRPNADDFC
jgi:hypothetical protein